MRPADAIVVLIQAALGSVLLIAVGGKIAEWETSIQWITQLGLRAPKVVLVSTLVLELGLVLTVAVAPGLAAPPGLAIIGGATLVLYVAKNKGLDCTCFGRTHRITNRSFIRNAMMAAGFAALGIAHANAPQSLAPGELAATVLATAGCILACHGLMAIRVLERGT